jgi:hypothetical protein
LCQQVQTEMISYERLKRLRSSRKNSYNYLNHSPLKHGRLQKRTHPRFIKYIAQDNGGMSYLNAWSTC